MVFGEEVRRVTGPVAIYAKLLRRAGSGLKIVNFDYMRQRVFGHLAICRPIPPVILTNPLLLTKISCEREIDLLLGNLPPGWTSGR